MKKSIAIVGGGTAGMFCAAFLNPDLFDVRLYEKKARLGRKFLVAGDGGLNLSHGEDIAQMRKRYSPSGILDKALLHFNNQDFRNWLEEIGIPSFEGSSHRIFPARGIKPIDVLNAVKKHLEKRGVVFYYNMEFSNWDTEKNLVFNEKETVIADINIFSLGGASWKITGSDGQWSTIFSDNEIALSPFIASNCAFEVDWQKEFIDKHEGTPLKNIAISIDGQEQKGEVVLSRFGLEGNAIYALSEKIQIQLAAKKETTIRIDFKPSLSLEAVLKKIENSNLKTTKTLKQVLKLSAAQIAMIKDTLSKDAFLDSNQLANTIKKFPLRLIAAATIDEAISTMGGVSLTAVDEHFQLFTMKNNYCIGEMLDWNAPTGGYLIQACASMGVYLASCLNEVYR